MNDYDAYTTDIRTIVTDATGEYFHEYERVNAVTGILALADAACLSVNARIIAAIGVVYRLASDAGTDDEMYLADLHLTNAIELALVARV